MMDNPDIIRVPVTCNNHLVACNSIKVDFQIRQAKTTVGTRFHLQLETAPPDRRNAESVSSTCQSSIVIAPGASAARASSFRRSGLAFFGSHS